MTEWLDEQPYSGPPEHDPYGFQYKRHDTLNGKEVSVYWRRPDSEQYGLSFSLGSFLKMDDDGPPIGVVVKKSIFKNTQNGEPIIRYYVVLQGTFAGSIS